VGCGRLFGQAPQTGQEQAAEHDHPGGWLLGHATQDHPLGVVRPCRKVRFARLIHAARAATLCAHGWVWPRYQVGEVAAKVIQSLVHHELVLCWKKCARVETWMSPVQLEVSFQEV
jgi:predicted Abi (CAAX) family protease